MYVAIYTGHRGEDKKEGVLRGEGEKEPRLDWLIPGYKSETKCGKGVQQKSREKTDP